MTKDKLQKVKAEMFRLKDAILALERREKTYANCYCGCRESGMVRRSSLDLSRALSDLRRR